MRIELCSPAQGETVALLTDGHRAMLSGRHLAEADDSLDWRSLKQKGTEKSYPQPVKFVWKTDPDETGEQAACLFIGTAPDLADAKKVIIPAGEKQAEVYNFSAGTEYYWKVVLTGPDGTSESPVGQFFTLDEVPTLYRVDGITNVRDIGGWHTIDGRRVKQGMLFRGSEMDTHHCLTPKGRLALKNDMGIRTDLDLREEALGLLTRSPIGPDIRFELIPVKAYAEFMAPENCEDCRAVFSVLADETAYPIYLHCWGGADRAGTVVLLLNGLLGVDDESLLLDYEMTLFSVWGERSRSSVLFRGLLEALDRYGEHDAPLRIKAENYLRASGVTNSQISTIRALLTV